MARGFLSQLVTPAVADAQERYYGISSRRVLSPQEDPLTSRETEFISDRDSFYISSVGETGWPYIQHRGGPKGFLHVLSPVELAFADYKGNRQMLSVGNVSTNDRTCLFLMDYPNKTRLKIIGRTQVLDARKHPELVHALAPSGLQPSVERIFKISVVSYDWNCPQYITPRFSEEEIEQAVVPLKDRISELENQLKQ